MISVSSLRAFVLAVLVVASVSPAVVAQEDSAPAPLRALDFEPFESALDALSPERRAELDGLVIEATFEELQSAMDAGDLTSVELTTYYLSRIAELDVGGLQSMNELNPDALDIAATLDEERAAGNKRGPLHGIPISLKDNIGTGDQMHNTSGAAALADVRSDRDSLVAAGLRETGAVILGKANLSEWANFISSSGQHDGFSALGGQVQNAHDPARSPLGSSAGSAVGTSTSLVAASIGTETLGSIIAPASVNGVVGIKPSLGLVSRDRIIPITDQFDTAGPIARTVTDAAVLLGAIDGVDDDDSATSVAAALEDTDYTAFLDTDALVGERVGFFTGSPASVTSGRWLESVGFADAIAGLEASGAVLSPVGANPLNNVEMFLGLGMVGIRDGVAAYLLATDADGPIATLADVVTFNDQDPDRYAPFGQGLLRRAARFREVSREDYEVGAAELRAEARAYLDVLFSQNDVDVIVADGDRLATAYAIAGHPAITVPAGREDDGTTLGLTFIGRYLEDAQLIGYAYAYEQASRLRALPPGVACRHRPRPPAPRDARGARRRSGEPWCWDRGSGGDWGVTSGWAHSGMYGRTT